MNPEKYVQGIVSITLLIVLGCLIVAVDMKHSGGWILIGMCLGVLAASLIGAFRK